MKWWASWVLLSCLFQISYSWDVEDYELFDLVEEVNTNFYALLGVPEDANSTEIKKAYRKLSLLLHPDKNDAADAEIKFRQLVAVYDVLRDNNKRSRYNLVLQNGLPDWRHVAFYYRRVRKMGLAEMSLILFIIVTVGQYVVAWAAYLEKKYTLEQLWEAKMKKLQKKQRKGKYDGPAIPETVPVQIPTPRSEEEEDVVEIEHKVPRRRKGKATLLANSSSWEPSYVSSQKDQEQIEDSSSPLPVSGGLWTDDDLAELVRLVKKFPPGSASRWEKISHTMQRPVAEVTHMAKKVKEDGYRMIRQNEEGPVSPENEEDKPRKVKTRASKMEDNLNVNDTSGWSQPQQKALEAALTKYPKGGTTDRWEKIAKCVPGKTKDECMLRYKHLVEVVKKKKETVDTVPSSENLA
ncbi:Putative chaperone protein dnaj [Gryllus bimaculatus]|nr:Putative chaperone protein dnaj [Gryllus bimaculatus]